jgi:hypothetical protein
MEMLLPGLKEDMIRRICDMESRMAKAGVDNRNIIRRVVNSRRFHLGDEDLRMAVYDDLIRFEEHLRGRYRCG